MLAHAFYFLEWIVNTLSAAGDWISYHAQRVTGDPVLGGSVLAVVAVLIGLAVLKRRASN
jgi:hypothetical protein